MLSARREHLMVYSQYPTKGLMVYSSIAVSAKKVPKYVPKIGISIILRKISLVLITVLVHMPKNFATKNLLQIG